MCKITLVPFEEYSLDDSKLMNAMTLLSQATKDENNPFLVPREVDFYLKSSLCIAYIYLNNNFAGASSVISCLDNMTGNKMWVGSKLVVELGSNFVDPDYRGQGIAKEFVKRRLVYCAANNYFAVSVTSNKIMKKIFTELGGVRMDKYPEYADLCSRVRTCNCPKGQEIHNQDCKMLDKEVWMFINKFCRE